MLKNWRLYGWQQRRSRLVDRRNGQRLSLYTCVCGFSFASHPL
ncbi:hypothetical protein [Nostoc punctiforme]|nr:hypothetical protein [Nostoc punctiforme]